MRLASRADLQVRTLLSRRETRDRLLVFDDGFPQRFSGFRMAEFVHLLNAFRSARVYSTGAALPLLGERRPLAEVLDEFERSNPGLKGRAKSLPARRVPIGGLSYTIFLHNTYNFLTHAESATRALVFTLYPGGGFLLDDPSSDTKLRRIFDSPALKQVIVTQKLTRDYLIAKGFCAPTDLCMVFGCPVPEVLFHPPDAPRPRYGIDKDTLDICFAAHKYTPGGVDKGYDVFVDVARQLIGQFPEARFHVMGPWQHSDGDFGAAKSRVCFHGHLDAAAARRLYFGMDAILSPNAASRLGRGAFDGFPTGCCVEAALCGVAVFCTDPLDLNLPFTNHRDLVIVSGGSDSISDALGSYFSAPFRLASLAENGRTAFRQVFSQDSQMGPRIETLNRWLR